MDLQHFSEKPLGEIRSTLQPDDPYQMKPKGLWISDESNLGWSEWCREEDFGIERLACCHRIVLNPKADILLVETVEDIDIFTKAYMKPPLAEAGPFLRSYCMDWVRVAKNFEGMIITPYLWDRRLSQEAFWYYSWDCASGCIWNATAIESVELIKGQ